MTATADGAASGKGASHAADDPGRCCHRPWPDHGCDLGGARAHGFKFAPMFGRLLADVRVISVILGSVFGAAFVATGVGLLGNVTWWPTSAVIAGLGGVVIMVVWFNAWLILGLAISAAVLVAGLRGLGTS